MKINKFGVLFSLMFAILSYLLTKQIIISVFCLIFSLGDSLFLLSKDIKNNNLKKEENEFKEAFITESLLRYNDNYQGDILQDILDLFEDKYIHVDKESIGEEIIKEKSVMLSNKLLDYKKKRKTKMFYSLLHLESINSHYEYLENKMKAKRDNYNLLISYACLILGVAIIKLLLSNFFTSLLSNNIFFLSIVLFLGVFWIVSRNVLSNLVED